jgi:hypothetical protein
MSAGGEDVQRLSAGTGPSLGARTGIWYDSCIESMSTPF